METVRTSELEDLLFEEGLDDVRVREDYSGRAMYGEKCVGLVGSQAELATALAAMGAHLGERGLSIARKARYDAMGLSAIVYFPGVQAEGGAEA